MVEAVNPEEFVTQQQRKKIEDYEFVKVRLDAGVAHMTLNRPEHNLLNEAMLRELAEGIEYSGSREDIKIILLDSACKVFCGGIEIGEYTSQRVFQMLDAFHAAFAAMVDVAKPVICVVNGPAIGGGAELAAFGDLVIATPKARFAQPEITIGMFPPLASTILPYLVGPKTALELVLTGEPVTAERALELGLVNRLVPEAHGTFIARRTEALHEHFPERIVPAGRFAGRSACAGRKTQTKLEESLTGSQNSEWCRQQRASRLIRFDAHCTHGLHSVHNLQARGAGKAVKLGRGPATVIG